MNNEFGTISGCVAGCVVILLGIFVDPLMMVLGGMIFVSSILASVVEARRFKFQVLESEKLGSQKEFTQEISA